MKIKGLYEMIETKYPPEQKLAYYNHALLNTLLDSFIRLQMPDQVFEILKYFKAKGRSPKGMLLKTLSRMDYLSDEIYYMLGQFDTEMQRGPRKKRAATGNSVDPSTEKLKQVVEELTVDQTKKNKFFV